MITANQIAVRIDDITPDMDWNSFYRFKELLDKYKIKPLIGVVPENRDINLRRGNTKEGFWEYIKGLQSEGWSIAQHGYQHQYTTECGGLFPLNHFSEFAGLSYEEQLNKLRRGKEALQEHHIETDIFMAPGHSFDKNTLKALKELGFHYITDGFCNTLYKRDELIFVPIAAQRNKVFGKKQAVSTLVYHLNGMTDEQYIQYENELQKVSGSKAYSQIIEGSAKEYTFYMGMKEKMMAAAKHYMVELRKKR